MQSFALTILFLALFSLPIVANAQWDAQARSVSRSVRIVDGRVDGNVATATERAWLARVAAALPVDGSLEAEFGEVRVCLGPDDEAACVLSDWSGALPELLQIVRGAVRPPQPSRTRWRRLTSL